MTLRVRTVLLAALLSAAFGGGPAYADWTESRHSLQDARTGELGDLKVAVAEGVENAESLLRQQLPYLENSVHTIVSSDYSESATRYFIREVKNRALATFKGEKFYGLVFVGL